MTWHPLVSRQLRNAFPGGVPGLAELHAFVVSVSDAYAAADGDRRELEHSLELASEELFERNRALERQIEDLTRLELDLARRTAELDRRHRDMALILDNVAQGLATVSLDGSIGVECSQAFTRWFGAPDASSRIWSQLAGADPNLAAWIQLGFETLRSDTMPLEVVLSQLPPRLERGGRQLRVEYQPIGDPLTALLVVVTDITDELARDRAERTQRELYSVVEKAYRDRSGFLAFIRETNQLVLCRRPAGVPLDELQRQIHTLKGSAALFGVVSVAEVCHALESAMQSEQVAPDRAAWASLVDTWHQFHDRADSLLRISERRSILVDWEEYQAVLASIGDPAPAWAARIRRWGEDATRSHLERFAAQAIELARRLGKDDLEVEIRDNELRVDTDRFAPLWSALVHAVRNAVDHGIEPADQRVARGKPAHGRLILTTELRGDELVVEVQDDGAGVDWPAVAARARALGLPAATHRDLDEAVFSNGLSTAREVTLTSGRGLGITALRAACVELGGHVELSSEPGGGTTVRCTLPVSWSRSRTRGASLARG